MFPNRLLSAAIALALLGAPASAAAEPPQLALSLQASAGFGVLEEYSWSYPGVDVIGRVRWGSQRRWFSEVRLGYAPLDNHTYLSDGRTTRYGAGAGVHLLSRGQLRATGTVTVEDIAFHPDPDIAAEHPDIDQRISLGALTPAAGADLAYTFSSGLVAGVFTRVALRRTTLFESVDGDLRARLVLGGFFLEFPLLGR